MPDNTTLPLLILLSTLLYAGVYTFNQIHDIESDRKNSKLFFLADDLISVQSAYIFTVVLFIAAVALAFYMSTDAGILFAFILVLGILYSHPLTDFKGKPSHGYWSNAVGHGLVPFMIGWLVFADMSLESAIKSVPYMLGVGAIYLNTTLPDREGDKAVGKITHGVRWGVAKTTYAALFLVILATIIAQMVGDYAFLISGLVSLPFFILSARDQTIERVVMATRVAILALTLFACVYYPPYLILLVIGYFASRAYYKSRFDLDYPSIK